MKYVNLIAVISLALCIGGCANTGTVHEKRQIQPNQKIGIMWNIGSFPDPHMSEVMIRDRTFEGAYEACVNALFERTFEANGYKVRAMKGQRVDQRLADAAYILVLQNTSAEYPTVGGKGSAAPLLSLPFLRLNMEGALFDRQSGKRLWSTTEWLTSDATRNGLAPVRLIKGLAADGFLAIKSADVVDYLGQNSASSKNQKLGCP